MNVLTRMWKREWPLHLMLVPGIVLVLIFSYIPMAGITMAFQKYVPNKGLFGSPFIGLKNLQLLMDYPDIGRIFFNTVYIAVMKIVAGMVVPVTIAILLNELRKEWVKRTFQTLVYLPHFLSWVLLSGILIDVLSPSSGILNQVLGLFGIDPVFSWETISGSLMSWSYRMYGKSLDLVRLSIWLRLPVLIRHCTRQRRSTVQDALSRRYM